jgi:cell division protein FtsW
MNQLRVAIQRITGRKRPPVMQSEYGWIVTLVLVLIAFGAVMVYSASSARNSLDSGGLGMGFLIRTVGFGLVFGVPACLIAQRMPLERLRELSPMILMASVGLLVAVMIPGIGHVANGARRWIGVSAFSFQPSELAKLALIVVTADRVISHRRRIRNLKDAFGVVILPIVAIAALIAAEPDLGTAIVCMVTGMLILWLGGTPVRVLGPALFGISIAAIGYTAISPYRLARLTAFLDPWQHASSSGFQSVQGQIALGSGGLTGVGLGDSVQKIFYLPEAHTDFILAVIGEELGVLGVIALLACFGGLLVMGMRVARNATEPFAQLVAAGVTVLITCQALLNICVVLGVAPLTGVPLPFISYGPTNLVVLLSATGLLLNVAATGGVRLKAVPDHETEGSDERDARADRRRRDGGAHSARSQRRGRAQG